MVDTKASIQLEGSGSLSKYLEDLQKSMGDLNKVTAEQTKGFEKLNKTGTDTGSFVGDLLKDVKELVSTGKDLTKGTKDTFSFLTSTAENTIKLNDALDDSTKGLSGFGLRLVGLRDDFSRLNSVVSTPAGHFRDIAEAQGMTAKAFVILDKTSKPIISGLNLLSNQLEKAEQGFRNAEVIVAGFSQTIVNTGAKSLTFFSQTFDNLAENIGKSGLLGRMFAGTFSGVAKTLDEGAKSAEKFGKSISPEQFVRVDAAGEKLAKTLDTTGRGLDRLATGVRLADAVGDVARFTLGIKESAEAAGEDLAGGIEKSTAAAKFAIPMYLKMNGRLQLVTTAAKAAAFVTGNSLAGALAMVGTNLTKLTVASGTFLTLSKGAADAYIQTKGLNDTFDVMQRMGIDTSAASIAFQFGIVGEKLLFSANAAKEFGKTAITAFTQLEDAAAFVTTLGAGSSLQFEGLEAGVESISAAMSDLVSGPLKNTVTSLEATNALYNSLSAGVGIASDGTVNLGEANAFLSASLKLAAGTGADTAQTLELLAKTSKVYGLSNAEAADTAAKLYQIVEQGIVTFPQLTGSLGRTLSVAKATGVGIDEAAGSIAALTKVMSADDAQTGLASLLQSIAGQGEQAQNALKDLGIRFDVNSIKSKGLIASLDDLYKATGGNASALKEIIPDALGFQTALTLMTSASKDAAATTELVANSGGEMLDNVFEKRQQSTVQQFSMIMNGFNEVLIDFGRRALPAIQPGVDFLQTLLNLLQNLPEPLKALIGGVILFQTTLSNVGGGLLSFGLTIAQIAASMTAFRIASKAFSGNLGKEFQVLRDINANGVDLVGTLLRLVGLNEKFDAATASANATLKAQKDILKSLSKEKINFEGPIESSKGLNSALKNTQEKIKETKAKLEVLRATDSLVDISKTEKELQKLENIENKITKFKKRLDGTKTDLFSDLQGSIDKVLSSVQVTVEEKRKTLQARLNNYFTIFGDTGEKYKAEIDDIFANIISDESLDTAAKVEKINQKFKALGEDVSPDIKKNFDKVQEELVEAVQRLDGTFAGELTKVVDRGRNLFSNLVNSKGAEQVRKGMEELASSFSQGGAQISQEVDKVLGNTESTLKEKIAQINSVFEKIGASVPEEVKENLNKVKEAIIESVSQIEATGDFEQLNLELGDIASPTIQERVSSNLDKLRQQAEEKAKQLKNAVDTSVTQLNLDLESVGGPDVTNKVQKNLANAEDVVRKGMHGLEQVAEKGAAKVNSSMDKLGKSKGAAKLQGLFGSVGDLVSNFVPGVGSAMSVLRDFGDVAESAGLDVEKLGKAQGKASKFTKFFTLDMDSVNMKMFSFGKGAKGATSGVSLFAKAGGVLTKVTGLLSAGFSAVSISLGSLLALIGPFVAIAAVAAGAMYLLHNALKLLIPGYAALTDENVKLANSMKKTDEQVIASTELIREMTTSLDELSNTGGKSLDFFKDFDSREALAFLDKEDVKNLAGLNDEQVRELREEIIKATVPDEKAFVQGWRAPIISLTEFITGSIIKVFGNLGTAILSGNKAVISFIGSITERIPFVGKAFSSVAEGIDSLTLRWRKGQKDLEKENRNFFNRVREGIQANIAAPARMAAIESRAAVSDLLIETNKLNNAYQQGGVAFAESQGVVKKAAEENRALRASELQEILANEQELNTKAREEIQKNIEAKQKELEAAKDPVVKQELQSQIDALQQRNTELENGIKLQQTYLQNVTAILQNRDSNQAVSGVGNLVERTQQIMNDLSEDARAKFIELNDIALDAEGNVTGVTGNLVNASQRRAEVAFQGASASFLQTLEDISDPTKGINQDKIASDLFGVLEAIDSKVAEGVVDFETGERLKEQYSNVTADIKIDGVVQTVKVTDTLTAQQNKQLEESALAAIRTIAEKGIAIREAASKKVQALEGQNLITAVDSAKQQEQINEEIGQFKIDAEERVLARIIQNQGESSEAAKAQARVVEQLKLDVALQGFNDRKKVLDEEFNLLQRQKENEIKKIELVAEKEKSAMDLRIKSMNLEQQARQASQDLSVAIANLEATTLQNKLKFTGDIVDKAKIELQLAQDRQVALAAEQEFELQNLELQQELNKLGLEREKIELRVQAAQLNSQKILAQAKLDQADALNLTEEERTALQLQVDALNQQIGLNGQQQAQLVKQGETQEQINEKQREGLLIRQEGARQTSAADVDLAKLELVNAGYERQKEILRNNAREVEMSGEERLQNLKEQETLLNSQTTVIQKQLDIVKQTQDISQRFFDIAKSSARSGFIQRRIEKEAAQERLKNLESVQKMEQVNLQIQQQQRDLALVRKEIELEVAEAKQVASLAEAQAEQARIEADPRSTEEQKRAAALGVIAQETGLRAIGSQREALGIEKALNDFVNMTEQQQQQREFGLQTLEAEQAVASTTRVRTDDRRIGTRALAIGRESADQVESLLQQFQGNNQLIPINTSGAVTLPTLQNSGGRTQSITDTMGGSGSTASLNQNQGTMNQIGGKVEVVLEIKGDAAKLDKEALQKAASDGLYEGLNKLFDYSLNRK